MRLLAATFTAITAVALAASAGCGPLGVGTPSRGAGSASSQAVTPVVAPSPLITITTPVRGAFLATGQAAVEGSVFGVGGVPVTSVVLQGQPVQVDAAGRFRGFLTLVPGLNVIEAQCTDAAGGSGSTAVGVLAGTYQAPAQPVRHAAIARLTNPALDAAAKIAESALKQQDWTKTLQGLGTIDATDFLWIHVFMDINRVSYLDVAASMAAQTGGLGVTVDVKKLELDITIEADLGFAHVGPYPAVATADVAQLTALAGIAVGADGAFSTSFPSSNLSLQNFQFTIQSGLLNSAVQLFAMNTIETKLKTWVDTEVAQKLPPFVDKQIAEAFQPSVPWTVLDKPFQIDLRGERVDFDSQGVSLAMRFNAQGGTPTALALTAPGSYVTAGDAPSTFPNRGVFASIDDNAINRVFHAMWAGGILDLDVDDAFLAKNMTTTTIQLRCKTIKSFLPEIGVNVADDAPMKIHIQPKLPPIVQLTGAPDLVRVQAGEVALDVLVDRGSGFEKLFRVVIHMDLGAGVTFTNKGLQLQSVSAPSFKLDIMDMPIVNLDKRHLEVLLSVMLTPEIPHLLNSMDVIKIPYLDQLATVNVSSYADGPAGDHLSIAADLQR